MPLVRGMKSTLRKISALSARIEKARAKGYESTVEELSAEMQELEAKFATLKAQTDSQKKKP